MMRKEAVAPLPFPPIQDQRSRVRAQANNRRYTELPH